MTHADGHAAIHDNGTDVERFQPIVRRGAARLLGDLLRCALSRNQLQHRWVQFIPEARPAVRQTVGAYPAASPCTTETLEGDLIEILGGLGRSAAVT